ncbi:MAG TPA: hypothetical protein ENN60_01820 [archaeon]|nr:hypothetical protein [archaeon]
MRYKRPDQKNAESICAAAERDMKYTLSLPVTEASAATIVRNIYECFRMLGEAMLIKKGFETEDHVAPLKELTQLKVKTTRPLRTIENLRNLRHNINYNGYAPTIAETNDILNLARCCFEPLAKKVWKNIKSESGD